jgi:hypothetical protein
MMMETSVVPSALLAPNEIRLLWRALGEWSGPARCSDELAFGMGFESAADLLAKCDAFSSALLSDTPVTPPDWARILLAVEIVFVSDLSGSGVEWPTTTGLTDAETIGVLRLIQRKLARTVRAYYGKRPTG